MTYNYQLSKEAELDVSEYYLWYEKQQEGLGERFLSVLDQAEEDIKISPNSYRIRHKNVRGFVVDRFPFIILYILENQDIKVLSVFHMKKEPSSWKDRS